jgi:hypothetical protein
MDGHGESHPLPIFVALQDRPVKGAPVFASLVGTLQRHSLASYEPNVDNSFVLRFEWYNPEMKQPYVERTELGEHVWLRFCEAGANVPDVWTTPASSLEVQTFNLRPMSRRPTRCKPDSQLIT